MTENIKFTFRFYGVYLGSVTKHLMYSISILCISSTAVQRLAPPGALAPCFLPKPKDEHGRLTGVSKFALGPDVRSMKLQAACETRIVLLYICQFFFRVHDQIL